MLVERQIVLEEDRVAVEIFNKCALDKIEVIDHFNEVGFKTSF
jgi:hypothetical protein